MGSGESERGFSVRHERNSEVHVGAEEFKYAFQRLGKDEGKVLLGWIRILTALETFGVCLCH
jgi:hypothetical protein